MQSGRHIFQELEVCSRLRRCARQCLAVGDASYDMYEDLLTCSGDEHALECGTHQLNPKYNVADCYVRGAMHVTACTPCYDM
jgi:hypothetical protein